MPKNSWSERQLEELKARYPDERAKCIARDIGKTLSSVYAKAAALGLMKSPAFLAGTHSGRLNGNSRWTPWSGEDEAVLQQDYANRPTEKIARELGRTINAVYGRAKQLGLRKSATYLASPASGRTDGTRGLSARFLPGHTPANKGKKGWRAGGRSEETQFKKGHRPRNWVPVGTRRRTTKERFWIEKVKEDGLQRERWMPVHRLLWEKNYGPIPARHIVRFKDGNVDNLAIANLECISQGENMRRNTIQNLPDDLREVVRAKGVLTRTINQKRKEDEEQTAGSA